MTVDCWVLIIYFAIAGEPALPSAPIVTEFTSEKSCWKAYTAIVAEYYARRQKAEILGGCYEK